MAGPWLVYNSFRRHSMDGSIDLDDDTFFISLYTDASNAADMTLQVIGEVTNEVADGNGYTSGGQQLANVTWDVGSYLAEMRFSADSTQWNASGGDIASIRYAVIWRKGATPADDILMLNADLGSITAADGNPFVVGPNIGGIFELN